MQSMPWYDKRFFFYAFFIGNSFGLHQKGKKKLVFSKLRIRSFDKMIEKGTNEK